MSYSTLSNSGSELHHSVAHGYFDSYQSSDDIRHTPAAIRAPIVKVNAVANVNAAKAKARHAAILVGKGTDASIVRAIYDDLLAEGLLPHLIGCQPGEIDVNDGRLDIEISLDAESTPLYDALVIADGEGSMPQLARNNKALAFVRQQYCHCRPILVVGNSIKLLAKAEIQMALDDGLPDPTIFIGAGLQLKKVFTAFKEALIAPVSFRREPQSLLV